ncbi:hypothetical protein [Winogradskyella sp. Asnod2-B02-A]|jgi:hypothetical protein|uniref:hypothetical protein n=1 Tax=Winogradskyella sp. Asnod2-B02-A TaxID=3160583 RepID=UPI003865F7B7
MRKTILLILILILFHSCGKKYGEIKSDFRNPEKLIIETEKEKKETTDKTIISEFLTLTENAYEIEPHKCMYNFKIHLVNDKNEILTFYLTKGHSQNYYEFSNNGTFEMDKSKFENLIKSLDYELSEL